MATHTEDHVDRALDAFAEVAREGIVDAEREKVLALLQIEEQSEPSQVP